jgi:invasion protein IalB
MRPSFAATLAFTLAASILALPVQAQQPAAPTPAPPGRAWTVNCAETPATPPRNCQLGTGVMIQPQNRRIAQVIVLRQPETRSLSLVFQMPHGALLPPGMTWQVDESEVQQAAYQNSSPEGLFVVLPLTDAVLAMLRRGNTLKLSFVAAAQRQNVTLPVPLAGFSAATTEFFAAENRAR